MIVPMLYNVYLLIVQKSPKNSFKLIGFYWFLNIKFLFFFPFLFSYLSLLNELALNNTRKHFSFSPKFDLIQLSSYIQTLASSLYNYLKQTIFHQQTNQRQLSIQLELTETETCALEVNFIKKYFIFIENLFI